MVPALIELMKDTPIHTGGTEPSGDFEPFQELPTIHDTHFPDWRPNVDIGETASHYVIVIELAGVKREDIALIYENGTLTIEAQAASSQHRDWNCFMREERAKGHCCRTFALPANVDTAQRRESYTEGLLRIWIPKSGDITAMPNVIDALEETRERPIKPSLDKAIGDEPTTNVL
ncbi:MAG: HSP20 family molecular chaperone IbpA [Verrucomicrobiales bacterium]|jgi:HSP20 family molecular chaperone IbpA